MRHFAVVGSGPAGFYTAEALSKTYGDKARIDILDRYPVPYGLIRFGVAPDHQSLKAVSKRYDKVADEPGVDFIGNVTVGSDVSVEELLELYDAVILAIGAPHDRKLGIPGEDLAGVVGSAEFVGWYNGHPEFADLDPPLGGTHAAVIGNGNVALDCARILSKTQHEFEGSDIVGHALEALDGSTIRTVTILGRRGPHQIAMTPKELGELGHLEEASPVVDAADFPPVEADDALEPGHRKSITILREFAGMPADPAKPKRMVFDFFAKPLRIEGDGKAERIIVERTELDENGAARGTGETYEVPASLVITAIGYSTPQMAGVPYDERGGKFRNEGGIICDRQ
jgi:ferredoxin--NADP+ reductase